MDLVPDPDPEILLIDRARGGDAHALAAVVALWGPRVRRMASRLCPVTEALDAAQESLLVLSTKLGGLRSSEALVSWTFQIVRRQCQRAFSRVRRETDLARHLGFLAPDQERSAPEDRLSLGELARIVAELPERDRAVLTCRDLEGLSLAETAYRLGLGLAAAKSRLHRARATLRQRMVSSPLARTLRRW
ncbi:MAG TPA: sigma-70 family RNA polymerase sigma factor [Spirochaetia bacterium]|jgi:RNA polymerase sigma factor (sigma-70 family)|nr:sigma-70 family RNA polymerase sigma factor [Spirochaetia bacterium]